VRRPDSVTLSKRLGEAVVNAMKPSTGVTYLRGDGATIKYSAHSKDWDYYGVLKGATASGSVMFPFLIEHGFHTNPAECKFLNDDNNLRKIAKAEVDVLANYFGLTLKDGFTAEAEKPATVPENSNKPDTESNKVSNKTLPEKYGKAITVNLHQLKKGNTGEEVKALQILLIGRGYSVGKAGADGEFGADTETAVKAFQKDDGQTADGIAGVKTWGALLK
jgi:hypothetical protein